MSDNQRFTGKVEVISVTEFDRINEHVPSRPVEKFVAITMKARYGRILVGYTRVDREFAQQVKLGDSFKLACNLTEQRNDEYGLHWKATFCKIGGYATPSADELKAKRRAKMMKKLGLA